MANNEYRVGAAELMSDSMIDRMAIALAPFIQHGVADPYEAARAVLAVMRSPTEAMKYAGLRADPTEQGLLPPVHAWPAMVDAALAEVG